MTYRISITVSRVLVERIWSMCVWLLFLFFTRSIQFFFSSLVRQKRLLSRNLCSFRECFFVQRNFVWILVLPRFQRWQIYVVHHPSSFLAIASFFSIFFQLTVSLEILALGALIYHFYEIFSLFLASCNKSMMWDYTFDCPERLPFSHFTVMCQQHFYTTSNDKNRDSIDVIRNHDKTLFHYQNHIFTFLFFLWNFF